MVSRNHIIDVHDWRFGRGTMLQHILSSPALLWSNPTVFLILRCTNTNYYSVEDIHLARRTCELHLRGQGRLPYVTTATFAISRLVYARRREYTKFRKGCV